MSSSIYRLKAQLVEEEFDKDALYLYLAGRAGDSPSRLNNRRLFEFNETARAVLALTDGEHSVAGVAAAFAEKCQMTTAEILPDVTKLYEQLADQGIIELVQSVSKNRKENSKMTQAFSQKDRYLRNPDVVLREETEDGGLLFNPDTNQVKVINATSLFIWKQCDGTHDPASIATTLQQSFEDAPADAVAADVRVFLEDMLASGFIGTALPD